MRDLIPVEYIVRNQQLGNSSCRGGRGVQQNLAAGPGDLSDSATPGVTLGARELRDDGRLRTYTAACGICFYDGQRIPRRPSECFSSQSPRETSSEDWSSAMAFAPTAKRFYPAEREFLASTDERFRPVSARVGPRRRAVPSPTSTTESPRHGVHGPVALRPDRRTGNWIKATTSAGSANRREGTPHPPLAARLQNASSSDLVATLSDPDGWHRRTAQRLLVERADTNSIPSLRDKVREADPIASPSAVDPGGPGRLDPALFGPPWDPRLIASGPAAVDSASGEGSGGSLELVSVRRGHKSRVRLQVALTAGTFRIRRHSGAHEGIDPKTTAWNFRAAVISDSKDSRFGIPCPPGYFDRNPTCWRSSDDHPPRAIHPRRGQPNRSRNSSAS